MLSKRVNGKGKKLRLIPVLASLLDSKFVARRLSLSIYANFVLQFELLSTFLFNGSLPISVLQRFAACGSYVIARSATKLRA